MKLSPRHGLTALLLASSLSAFGCGKIKHLLHRDDAGVVAIVTTDGAVTPTPVAVPTSPTPDAVAVVVTADAAAPAQPAVAAVDASVPAVPTPPVQQVLVADAGAPPSVPVAPTAPVVPTAPTPNGPLVAAPEPDDGHRRRGHHRNYCKDHPGSINPETGAPCPLQGI